MMEDEVGRALREPALVASLPEPASGLRPAGDDAARVAFTLRFSDFVERLETFAERYCRVKPSLGMVGELFWVMGMDDFEFRLVPRDSDRNPEGEKPQALSAQHESAGPPGHRP